jgi:hypothetical protein
VNAGQAIAEFSGPGARVAYGVMGIQHGACQEDIKPAEQFGGFRVGSGGMPSTFVHGGFL